jgi:hypothetical protein
LPRAEPARQIAYSPAALRVLEKPRLDTVLKGSAVPEAARVPGKFVLTDQQKNAFRVLGGPQRHTLFYGGARSQKTFTFVKNIVNRALNADGSRHAILRLRANAVWASIGKDTLPKVMALCFPGIVLSGPHAEGYYQLPNGSQIWLGGLDEKERIEKILGMEFATLFFNETSQIPYATVLTALTRLAQVVFCKDGQPLSQRAYYDLNPTSKRHWTYVMFVQKRDPDTGKPLVDPSNYAYCFLSPKGNIANLTPDFLRSMEDLPSRKRKRFFEGEYGEEDDGILWSYELFDAGRRTIEQVPDLRTVVVAIDPSGASNETDTGHDAIGIVVAGTGVDGHGYVLEDITCLDGPSGWGKRAIAAYHRHHADHIVAEANFGGAMVEYTIKSLDPQVPVRLVTASRGKVVRAEPVSTLYGELLADEANSTTKLKSCKVHHVGALQDLEDECCGFTTLGYIGERSPNRVDALVWAITDLMLDGNAAAWIEHYAQLANKANTPDVIVVDTSERRGPRRPTPNAEPENELTELYRRTVRGLVHNEVICARKGCGLPVVGGDAKITDGVNVWHKGCH